MVKKKILIVDDEVQFTQIVKMNLEETGEFEVRVENRGKDALAAVKAFKPDLIFLDIIMPDVDGTQIAESLKDDVLLDEIPVVFLTALVTKEEILSGGENIAGRKFLAKPAMTSQIIKCIKENIRP